MGAFGEECVVRALEPQRERWDGPVGGDEPVTADVGLAADRAWREDVALEMWVDVTSGAVVIRLEGVLDASTGANLADVVRGCQAEGRGDVVLDTTALRMDRTGRALIEGLREQVEAAGGRLRWDTTVRA